MPHLIVDTDLCWIVTSSFLSAMPEVSPQNPMSLTSLATSPLPCPNSSPLVHYRTYLLCTFRYVVPVEPVSQHQWYICSFKCLILLDNERFKLLCPFGNQKRISNETKFKYGFEELILTSCYSHWTIYAPHSLCLSLYFHMFQWLLTNPDNTSLIRNFWVIGICIDWDFLYKNLLHVVGFYFMNSLNSCFTFLSLSSLQRL